nr:hypothetical protein Iba_chr14cCG9670 [Ipomoea batatas]
MVTLDHHAGSYHEAISSKASPGNSSVFHLLCSVNNMGCNYGEGFVLMETWMGYQSSLCGILWNSGDRNSLLVTSMGCGEERASICKYFQSIGTYVDSLLFSSFSQ